MKLRESCGHSDGPENTYTAPKTGKRGCRTCRNIAVNRHRAKRGQRQRPKTIAELAQSADRYVDVNRLVYFISNGNHVKIGSARDPRARLAELQIGTSTELSLIKTEVGGFPRENDLHRQFNHLRIRGEWFRLDGTLAAYLGSL